MFDSMIKINLFTSSPHKVPGKTAYSHRYYKRCTRSKHPSVGIIDSLGTQINQLFLYKKYYHIWQVFPSYNIFCSVCLFADFGVLCFLHHYWKLFFVYPENRDSGFQRSKIVRKHLNPFVAIYDWSQMGVIIYKGISIISPLVACPFLKMEASTIIRYNHHPVHHHHDL